LAAASAADVLAGEGFMIAAYAASREASAEASDRVVAIRTALLEGATQ
jgi:hypothetical protein